MKNLIDNKKASAISFIVGMLVIGLVVAGLVGTFAYNVNLAAENDSVAGGAAINTSDMDVETTAPGIPGGPAMLLILSLLFIIIPVVLFAKAAK